MSKLPETLIDDLVAGFSEYLVTFVHDFAATRKEAPEALIPEYTQLLQRLGRISARSAVAYVVNPLLAASEVDEALLRKQLAVLYNEIPEETLVDMAGQEAQLARARYLRQAIPEWQDKHGQLYPEEVVEMRELVARATTEDAAVLLPLLADLEDTWVLVQPGMRYHRGDADWIAALEQHIETAVDRLQEKDRENYLIQKCLLTMQGTSTIKQKAREVLDAQLAEVAQNREGIEGALAELDAQERALRDKRRGLR